MEQYQTPVTGGYVVAVWERRPTGKRIRRERSFHDIADAAEYFAASAECLTSTGDETSILLANVNNRTVEMRDVVSFRMDAERLTCHIHPLTQHGMPHQARANSLIAATRHAIDENCPALLRHMNNPETYS